MMSGRSAFKLSTLMLFTVLFCTEFVRSAFLFSFLPNFAVNESGQTVALVGLAVSLHYTADTLIKCVAGYLLDRFSLRWLLPATFVLMLSGLAAVFVSPYAWGLVAGSVMLGMGASPIWLICLEKIRLTERAAQIGAIYTVWLACIGLGPITINLTFDYGFVPAFRLMAALLAVGCIASFGINRTTPLHLQNVSFAEQATRLRRRLVQLKWLLPGMVLQMTAAGLLLPILPGFAADHLGLSQPQYSIMLIFGGAGAMLFLVPMGKLADRWGHKQMLFAGFVSLTVILALLIVSMPPPALTMLFAFMLGLSYSAVLPAWNAVLSYLVPEDQKGTGWGVLSGIEGLGIMIGPVIGGWIASQYTNEAAISISAALLAVLALFYLILPQNKLVSARGTLQHKRENAHGPDRVS
ncbi:MFS transporter [Paenibacillus jamilae]|uniref:MFS transporter n=4 Tax=Paenibacillus TaxID=44249 RepID=E3E4F4_PAEPS|nr:MFS transporter [Paenibacillus polymyxa]AUO08748.1 MFS transporter [Paenibacillus sp. lzh-N1]KTS73084.1 MFS transporter [Paenibacillus jamilae]CCC85384.1 putative glycolipid permease [Paenibacillus polymyxa M1]ADO56694.2 MFS transporter [Paenibacillus polymyxa SC2]WPQ54528.1 MFS transporter [Paenibacillus polymyxa]